MQSNIICLLSEVFRPFIFNVIIEIIGFKQISILLHTQEDSADFSSSFSVVLSSLSLENFCHFGLSRFPTLISSTQKECWVALGLPFHVLRLGNFLQVVNWGKHRTHFVSCLSEMTVVHLLISNVLKNGLVILYPVFNCF